MNEAEKAFLVMLALGHFQVDAKGRIWRAKRFVAGSRSGSPPAVRDLPKLRRADIATSGNRRTNSTGYLRVMFTAFGKRWKVNAHRVVWMIWNGQEIPKGMQINHLNGNGVDNRPENLELATQSQNIVHAIKHLGKMPHLWRANPGARLTEQQVLEIRDLWERRAMNQVELARLYRVTKETISEIVRRQTWKNLP